MFKRSWIGLILPFFCLPLLAAEADLPAGAAKEKVQTACAECHESRIIVQQRLSQAAWVKEVDKMVKWGALVQPADRDAIIQYLSSNFPPGKPPDPEIRTASGK